MATVTKGRTFVSGETVTPAKLNELVDNATVTSIVDADVSASAAIALSKLATGALPTAITVADANIVSGVDASKLTAGTLPIARIADAAVTPAKLSQPYTLDTAKASTSGTSIDFTGIPSWAKRITVLFNGVSTSGTSSLLIRIGDTGGFEDTGYTSAAFSQTNVLVTNTSGFVINATTVGAADVRHGLVTIATVGSNIWVASGHVSPASGQIATCSGTKTLSDTLTQVRITTVNGTDTFDAGTINIAYEG